MRKIIDLAIIIPTLNEEHYIGKLLDSIAAQTVQPQEIVVVDAQSKDKTALEVRKRRRTLPQLRFYQIPKYTISRQRNLGVKKTKAPHLLFLDADMILKDPQTLEKYFNEVVQRQPDIAVANNLPDSHSLKDKIFFKNMNLLFKSSKYFWPFVTTMNLYVSRATFKKVGGFDEEILVGEDSDFLQRTLKKGAKYLILTKPKLYTSVRRLQKEGRRKFILKLIKMYLHIRRNGFKDLPVEYEFGDHPKI